MKTNVHEYISIQTYPLISLAPYFSPLTSSISISLVISFISYRFSISGEIHMKSPENFESLSISREIISELFKNIPGKNHPGNQILA
jgi:hypothetical protein